MYDNMKETLQITSHKRLCKNPSFLHDRSQNTDDVIVIPLDHICPTNHYFLLAALQLQ